MCRQHLRSNGVANGRSQCCPNQDADASSDTRPVGVPIDGPELESNDPQPNESGGYLLANLGSHSHPDKDANAVPDASTNPSPVAKPDTDTDSSPKHAASDADAILEPDDGPDAGPDGAPYR